MRVVVDSLGEIPTSVVSGETKRKFARCILDLTLNSDEEDENNDDDQPENHDYDEAADGDED